MNTQDSQAIERHNAMIQKANARLEELWAAGIRAEARPNGQGVTITIERPSGRRGHVTRSFEIIAY